MLNDPSAGVACCRVPPTDEVRALLEPIEIKSGTRDATKRRASGEIGRAKMSKERLKLQDDADMAVARFFYECDVPFLRADDAAFRRMIRLVSDFGPGYLPPLRERIEDGKPWGQQASGGDAKGAGGGKTPGLLWNVLEEVRMEREDYLASAFRMGATMVSDGAKNNHFRAVAYAVATPKGVALIGVTDFGQHARLTADLLAQDAAAAMSKAGSNVFLMLMDGPLDMAAQSLEAVERIYPRVLTMRSAAFGWDMVMQEVGRKFVNEVLIPVHQVCLHVTNHEPLYSVFEGLKGGASALLMPPRTRFSAEVACALAFHEDRAALKNLWDHPVVTVWLEHRVASRGPVRERHTALGSQHVQSVDWWKMVEAFVAMLTAAVPLLGEANLDAPNLFKLPSMYDAALQGLQQPLAIAGQEVSTEGLAVWGGMMVAGAPGDGSVQASPPPQTKTPTEDTSPSLS